MEYLKLYFAADNSEVSPPATFINHIQFVLRADLQETDQVRLYVEVLEGYKVTNAQVAPQGMTTDKWAFALDVGGEPGEYGQWDEPIDLGDIVSKTYFWAKARSTNDEPAKNDSTVRVKIDGLAEAV